MPREKPIQNINRNFHQYSKIEEELLTSFQQRALEILRELETKGLIQGFVHGSVARGDVKSTSDVDIYLPFRISSYRLDLLTNFRGAERRIIMATPHSIIRGLLTRSDEVSLSFPLMPTNEREIEFFRFSGLLYLDQLRRHQRTTGITKRLILIEPEGDGYWQTPLQENVKRATQLLGLSQRIMDERIRVLLRRDKIGRTGVFMNASVLPDENYEQALKRLADRNPVVRRALRS